MILICSKNHKEVAFEGTNRELDCPVCKEREVGAVEVSLLKEEMAKVNEKSPKLKERKLSFQREEICAPYGGVRYAPWENCRPGNYTKGGR